MTPHEYVKRMKELAGAAAKSHHTALYHLSGSDRELLIESRTAIPRLCEALEIAIPALMDVVTLMTGAPAVAPMTDELVLERAREALTKISAILEGK